MRTVSEEDIAGIVSESVHTEPEALTGIEGGVNQRLVNTYERDPGLRAQAIHIHGVTCTVCQFNFESFYGERGRDYIEVHHLKQVSALAGPTEVDPSTDLTVVCSNCHRMIHRRRDSVLTPDELRALLRQHEQV
jgi:5-methylcytosine-specific restriction protein A